MQYNLYVLNIHISITPKIYGLLPMRFKLTLYINRSDVTHNLKNYTHTHVCTRVHIDTQTQTYNIRFLIRISKQYMIETT